MGDRDGNREGDADARRMFLADTRGGERHLRVSWHREPGTVIFSHWVDDVCVASTPVRLDEAATLVGFLVDALRDSASFGAVGPHSEPVGDGQVGHSADGRADAGSGAA